MRLWALVFRANLSLLPSEPFSITRSTQHTRDQVPVPPPSACTSPRGCTRFGEMRRVGVEDPQKGQREQTARCRAHTQHNWHQRPGRSRGSALHKALDKGALFIVQDTRRACSRFPERNPHRAVHSLIARRGYQKLSKPTFFGSLHQIPETGEERWANPPHKHLGTAPPGLCLQMAPAKPRHLTVRGGHNPQLMPARPRMGLYHQSLSLMQHFSSMS